MTACVTAAIVGEFQRGKSTLANALLGRNLAGRGRGLATTHNNRSFSLTPWVKIVDTPGFDANQKDSQTALAALQEADVFLYVHESKALGSTCANLFQMAREKGKSILFLLNCRNFEKWAPEENWDVAATIEAELSHKDIDRIILPFGKRLVVPINALWASFGAGLLAPSSEDDRKDSRKIRAYARDDLDIPGAATMSEKVFQTEMLRRSGVPEVRDWLMDLPVWRLRDVLEQPERTIDRICGQFAAELKQRWYAA